MTVRDLFSLNAEVFKEFRLLAGAKGLDNEIKDVVIMEVPDGIYWINPDNFVITTGYSLMTKEISIENMIQIMISRKAAALGIKIGKYIEKLPEKIIDYANEHNFPIISIPLAFTYNSMVFPILNKLKGEDSYQYYIVKKLREELNLLKRTNFNITSLIRLIEDYTNQKIFLYWASNLSLINNTDNVDNTALKKSILDNISQIYVAERPFEISSDTVSYAVFKVESLAEVLAFLCIRMEYGQLLTPVNEILINEVLPTVCIYLLTNLHTSAKYYKSADDFFLNILDGTYTGNELRLKEDASYLNIDFRASRFVCVIDTTIKTDDEFHTFREKITSALAAYTYHFIGQKHGNQTTLIFELKNSQNIQKTYESCFQSILGNLKKRFPAEHFSIGIGKACQSLKYLNYAHEEALFAIKIGKKLYAQQDGIYFYDNFMIYHLLYEISDHPTLSKIHKNTIERIQKYDLENNTALLKTLEMLVDCDFSISQTSDRLYIHRNTLYKRINKLNLLLDFDIDNSENRLILQIALKLHKILE
ncbi:hypothetical protein FND36_06410 [Lachnospiraceae bacterium KGMB03038]|nr:hypothetical protein FND36_06410 [Lachnospiraceae bacterium KGMB03038]